MRPGGACAAPAVLVLLMACGSSSGPFDPSPGSTPTPPAGGVFEYNGITHNSYWHDEYGLPEASVARSALAATGGNWSGLLTTWYMERRDSSAIAPLPLNTPADDVVRRAIDELHALGLRVMLKPHVDVRDGTWRGQIAPADPGSWFASYTAMMEHYAALAREADVEMLCVGTEYVTMTGSRYQAEWTRVIDRVRALYPGVLTYAANAASPADEFTSVSFWAQVDLLGLDVYTPLTGRMSPTRQELVDGWRRNREGHDMVAAYRNFQNAWGKPLIFTEVGYRSLDGTNRAPWDWQATAGADPAEQADCYQALYEVWSGETSWMQGLFWWAWSVASPGPGDTGYSPWGKPAEDVLRAWQGA